MSKFKDRFLDSLDSQLVCTFYSGSCLSTCALPETLHFKTGLVNVVFNTTLGRERNGKEGWGGVRWLDGKGLQGGHYFHVINIHQMNVKILIGQFSKHVNYGLDT